MRFTERYSTNQKYNTKHNKNNMPQNVKKEKLHFQIPISEVFWSVMEFTGFWLATDTHIIFSVVQKIEKKKIKNRDRQGEVRQEVQM